MENEILIAKIQCLIGYLQGTIDALKMHGILSKDEYLTNVCSNALDKIKKIDNTEK
jgi:hypothetical protein